MFRLITLRLRLASTPVTECGYRNSASDDPNASVMYCHWLLALSSRPPLLAVVNLVSAASKMVCQPPSLTGM